MRVGELAFYPLPPVALEKASPAPGLANTERTGPDGKGTGEPALRV